MWITLRLTISLGVTRANKINWFGFQIRGVPPRKSLKTGIQLHVERIELEHQSLHPKGTEITPVEICLPQIPKEMSEKCDAVIRNKSRLEEYLVWYGKSS